jgi:predicted RNA-binding protein with PIN domain
VTLVIVDAENVRRSRWPNIGRDELVDRVAAWAQAHGHEPLVVFDGRAPDGAVGSGAESADDWIARRAAELAARREAYWLVTSDRGLRERAAAAAERVVGGGAFAGQLLER